LEDSPLIPVVARLDSRYLEEDGRIGADRIVDKKAAGTGAHRRKKKNPDLMPGLRQEGKT